MDGLDSSFDGEYPMEDIKDLTRSLNSMSPDEREEELGRFKAQCICPICPSYNDCSKKKEELLFCIIGESENCIKEKKGLSMSSLSICQETRFRGPVQHLLYKGLRDGTAGINFINHKNSFKKWVIRLG